MGGRDGGREGWTGRTMRRRATERGRIDGGKEDEEWKRETEETKGSWEGRVGSEGEGGPTLWWR